MEKKIFIVKQGKREQAIRIIPQVAQKPSWQPVSWASNNPKPHIQKQVALANHKYVLSDVRVIEDADAIARLEAWDEEERRIQKARQEFLDGGFLTFRLAEYSDFPEVREGRSKQEAQEYLKSKSVDAEEGENRRNFLAGLMNDMAGTQKERRKSK